MITPNDIETKVFSSSLRGYNRQEVDEFLDQIIVDLEKLMKENLRLKTEIATLEQENEKFKGSEGEVVKVLEQARSLMGDISASAEKRAEVLMKNAELDAELMKKNAREESEALAKETQNLKARYTEFRNRYRRMLEMELQRFESSRGAEVSASSIVDFEDLPVAKDEEPLETVVTQDTIHTGKL